jgi:hypothetical protein
MAGALPFIKKEKKGLHTALTRPKIRQTCSTTNKKKRNILQGGKI